MIEDDDLDLVNMNEFPFHEIPNASGMFLTFVRLRFQDPQEIKISHMDLIKSRIFEALKEEYFVWLCSGAVVPIVDPEIYQLVKGKVFKYNSITQSCWITFKSLFKGPEGCPKEEKKLLVHRKDFQFSYSQINARFLPKGIKLPRVLKAQRPSNGWGGIKMSSVLPNEEAPLSLIPVAEVIEDKIIPFLYSNPTYKINIQEKMIHEIPFIDQIGAKEGFMIFNPRSRTIYKEKLKVTPLITNTYGIILDVNKEQLVPPYELKSISNFYFVPTSRCLEFSSLRFPSQGETQNHVTFPLTLGFFLTLLNEATESSNPLFYNKVITNLESAVIYLTSHWNPFKFAESVAKRIFPRSVWEGPIWEEHHQPGELDSIFSSFMNLLGFSVDVQFYPQESNQGSFLKTKFWFQGPNRVPLRMPNSPLFLVNGKEPFDSREILEAAAAERRRNENNPLTKENWKNMYLKLWVGDKVTFYFTPRT